MQELTEALHPARYAIASYCLAGRIDRDQVVELTQKYQLMTWGLAERAVQFIETYRSYAINYGLGKRMVEAYVNGTGSTQAERWAAMEKVLSEPT